MIRLFNKEFYASFHVPGPGEEALFGAAITPAECECGADIGYVLRIGFGALELDIVAQHPHK